MAEIITCGVPRKAIQLVPLSKKLHQVIAISGHVVPS